jgi:hypothetical protein
LPEQIPDDCERRDQQHEKERCGSPAGSSQIVFIWFFEPFNLCAEEIVRFGK